MNSPWALRLPEAASESLAPLRLEPGLEVLARPGEIWLRGASSNAALVAQLRLLPADERFRWKPPLNLCPEGSRIPSTRLPEGPWQKLDQWLTARLGTSAWPATAPRPVPLRLERCSIERPATLLFTEASTLRHWLQEAPQVRWQRLRVAVDTAGQALVLGEPLPPLPGPRFVCAEQVAVPAGYAWQPPVPVTVVRRRLGLGADALVVWWADGTFTRLHAEQFVPLTPAFGRETVG